ncbi:MAG TPA: hypothetical protein VF904_19925 [Anaeromyxobacteraceae bacterium]
MRAQCDADVATAQAEIAAGRLAWHGDKAQACLDALAGACGVSDLSCRDVLYGAVAEGDACQPLRMGLWSECAAGRCEEAVDVREY